MYIAQSMVMKRVLSFAAIGPGAGALPFVLVLFIGGLNDRTAPAFGLFTLVVSYPVGILPAALAGYFYHIALCKWGANSNRFMLGAMAGICSTALFIFPFMLQDAFKGYLNVSWGIQVGYLVISIYAGGTCGVLSRRLIERHS